MNWRNTGFGGSLAARTCRKSDFPLHTREFLDAYLKRDSSALVFLKRSPVANRVPKHVLDATFRQAIPSPFTFADFRKQVAEQGPSPVKSSAGSLACSK
jgi:hypothetical protein